MKDIKPKLVEDEIFRVYRQILESNLPKDMFPHEIEKLRLGDTGKLSKIFYITRAVTSDKCYYEKITRNKPSNSHISAGKASTWTLVSNFGPDYSFQSYQQKLLNDGWNVFLPIHVEAKPENQHKKVKFQEQEFTLENYTKNLKTREREKNFPSELKTFHSVNEASVNEANEANQANEEKHRERFTFLDIIRMRERKALKYPKMPPELKEELRLLEEPKLPKPLKPLIFNRSEQPKSTELKFKNKQAMLEYIRERMNK